MASVIITILPNGETRVHAEGIQGESCSLHTLPYVNAIGVKLAEEPLPEMFMEDNTNTQQEQKQ